MDSDQASCNARQKVAYPLIYSGLFEEYWLWRLRLLCELSKWLICPKRNKAHLKSKWSGLTFSRFDNVSGALIRFATISLPVRKYINPSATVAGPPESSNHMKQALELLKWKGRTEEKDMATHKLFKEHLRKNTGNRSWIPLHWPCKIINHFQHWRGKCKQYKTYWNFQWQAKRGTEFTKNLLKWTGYWCREMAFVSMKCRWASLRIRG